MSRIGKIIQTALVVGATSLPIASAHADLSIDFYNGTDLYATLTTTGGTDFDLHFVGTGVAAGGFIGDLYMAGPGGTFTDNSTDTTATGTYDSTGFTNAGYTFNWLIEFPTANTTSRLTIGEHALFSIVVTDPNAWDFNMIHIQAFDAAGNSIKLTGSTSTSTGSSGSSGTLSEPGSGTITLLGLALLAAGFVQRRMALQS